MLRCQWKGITSAGNQKKRKSKIQNKPLFSSWLNSNPICENGQSQNEKFPFILKIYTFIMKIIETQSGWN